MRQIIILIIGYIIIGILLKMIGLGWDNQNLGLIVNTSAVFGYTILVYGITNPE